MLRKIVYFLCIYLAAQGVFAQDCAYAGRDSFVCGLSIDLFGQPAGGFWTLVCEPGVKASLDSILPGTVRLKTAACGRYAMVYHYFDSICSSSDTVIISLEDRSFKFEEIKNNLSLVYQNVEDYDAPKDSCGHIRTLAGIKQYQPVYQYQFEAICERYFAFQTVNKLDTTNCLAASISSDVRTFRGNDQFTWTSSSNAFLFQDSANNEVNLFPEYYSILLNNFLEQLDTICPLQKCFVDASRCKDTLSFDSVWLDIPIFRGGQWRYNKDSIWSTLQDTNSIALNNKLYTLILPNGSQNYSEKPLTLVAFESDSINNFKELNSKLNITVKWFENWDTQRVHFIFPREIIDDQCICNGRTIQFSPFTTETFTLKEFKEIPICFLPKPEPVISGKTVFCDGNFSILGTTEMYAKYKWSNNDDQPTTFVFNSGTISLDVTNAQGCIGSDSVEVKEIIPPEFNIISSKKEICNGQCIDLSTNADSNYTVVWNTLDTIAKLMVCPSITQRYNATVIDTFGCKSQEVIQIKVTESPIPKAGNDITITCSILSAQLTVIRPDTNQNRKFIWIGNGIDSSTQNVLEPTVGKPGIYTFQVTDTITGCSGYDTIVVKSDTIHPVANAGRDMILSCNAKAVQLRGDSSQFGQGFSHEWSGPGIFSFNKFMINPLVEVKGEYILRIINLNNDCISYDTVQVLEDLRLPIADAGTEKLLYCDSAFITLGGLNTSTGSNIFYVWSGPAITVANRNQKNPQVNLAGRYSLVVINTDNFCNDTDFVNVVLPTNKPIATVTKSGDLGCGIDTVDLSSRFSIGSNLYYNWFGPILDTSSFLVKNWQATRGGDYILTIRDTLTHCESKDTISIIDKGPNPFVSAGPDKMINCENTEVLLEGTVVHPSSKLFVEWTGPDITSNNRMVRRPVIDSAGTYILYVIDSVSGCFSSDTVTITKELIKPTVDLGRDITLNCKEPFVDVVAKISNNKPNHYFEWQGPGITDASKRNISQEIKEGGTYVFFISTGNPECFASDTLRVIVDTAISRFFLPDTFALNCTLQKVHVKIDSFISFNEIFWFDEQNQLQASSKNGLEIELNKPGRFKIRSIQSNGCLYETETIVLPYEGIRINFVTNTICHNRSTGFIELNDIKGIGPFKVQFDNDIPGTSIKFENLKAGEHTITITDGRGCSESFRTPIPFFPVLMKPEPSSYDFTFCTDTVIEPPLPNIDAQLKWFDNNKLSPKREFKKGGQYTLQYIDKNMCDSFAIDFFLSRVEIDTTLLLEAIPNVFTPNGDNLNEVFRITFPENSVVDDFDMKIFNRFGHLVFQTKNIDGEWDGNYKGQMAPSETYLVVINGLLNICESNRMFFQFKTDLSLIR